MNNINTFVLLKKIFYIFLFIAGLNFSTQAQVSSTFINNDVVKTVKFYPNPAVSSINFEFEKNYVSSYNLVIYNFIGKKVVEMKISDQKMNITLTDFYRGVYIFQVRDKQGIVVESGKWQVAKESID